MLLSPAMRNLVVALLFILISLTYLLAVFLHFRDNSGQLRVTFFDVGQGDSVLLQFPQGKTLLVDSGGGSPNFTAGRMLIPELRSLGILDLDAVLLTHPDSDHILGFRDIASNVKIGEYWLNARFTEGNMVPLLWQVQWLFKRNEVRPRFFSKEEKLLWQGVEMGVIPSKGENENDQGLVLLLQYGKCRVLLTGDIEKSGEALVATKLLEPVHLLKVAHHGSKTSSTKSFLRKAHPQWSVISAGWGNRYGHPKGFVSERLRALGSEILRTDWHGYVQFSFDAHGKVGCKTARGFCGESQCL